MIIWYVDSHFCEMPIHFSYRFYMELILIFVSYSYMRNKYPLYSAISWFSFLILIHLYLLIRAFVYYWDIWMQIEKPSQFKVNIAELEYREVGKNSWGPLQYLKLFTNQYIAISPSSEKERKKRKEGRKESRKKGREGKKKIREGGREGREGGRDGKGREGWKKKHGPF